MGQFLYFIPHQAAEKTTPGGGATIATLHAAGLAYVFDPTEPCAEASAPCHQTDVANGPGDQHGKLISRSDHRLLYKPGEQVWKKEIGRDVWAGYWSDDAPKAGELARAAQIDGRWRTFGGQLWLCPHARQFVELDGGEIVGHVTLPRQLTRDDDGQWMPGEVKPRWRRLWDMAEAYFDTALAAPENGNGDATFRFAQIDDLAIECLATNYRVSAIEVDLLGFYDDQVREALLNTVLDMDGYAELQIKKIAGVGGTLSDGRAQPTPAEIVDTRQL